MVLILALIATFIPAPSHHNGPSPYVCTPSGAGMLATCREKAQKERDLDAGATG
jgi:hypothetical protein